MNRINWTCTEGARGHVVSREGRWPGVVVEVAPTSIAVQYDAPDTLRSAWFNTDPGKRYLRRLGDTSERALRFEPEEIS